MENCKEGVFAEKNLVVKFEDFESGEVSLPTQQEALDGIKTCESVPKLFSNVKAYLMQSGDMQGGNQSQTYKPISFTPQFSGVIVSAAVGLCCREGSYLIMQGSFKKTDAVSEWRLLLPENLTIANSLKSLSTYGTICGSFESIEDNTAAIFIPLARAGDKYIRFAFRSATNNAIYVGGASANRIYSFDLRVPIQEWM